MVDLSKYPMVEALIMNMRGSNWMTTDEALEYIHKQFDADGPYHFAKNWYQLVNNSGEEFAIQFMSAYNQFYPGTY